MDYCKQWYTVNNNIFNLSTLLTWDIVFRNQRKILYQYDPSLMKNMCGRRMYWEINSLFWFFHYIFSSLSTLIPNSKKRIRPIVFPGEVGGIGLKTEVFCQQPPFLAFVFWKPKFLGRIVLELGGGGNWEGERKQPDTESFPRLERGLESTDPLLGGTSTPK